MDFHVGLHPDLHAGLVADRRRHELVAGGADHLPGQLHRAGADGPQRPRRHAVRHSVSGLLPGGVRHARRECAGAAAGPGRVRLVRHPDLDRRQGDLQDPGRLPSRLGQSCPRSPGSASTSPQLVCFLFFWAVNMLVIYRGIDSIRVLLNIKAPLLIALGLALLAWAYVQAGGFGPMLSQPSQFAPGQPKAGQFWAFFFPALTAMIGFWATLSLNIPDFTRYARSQRDQIVGQAIGLPPTMALYSFIGVAVTSATMVIYGADDLGPGGAADQVHAIPWCWSWRMFALCLATLATNIAANVVSPANDFAHLWPRRISFRIGGLITGVIGILIQPWKLVADPTGYILHLADRLLFAARRCRRRADRRLLCLASDPTRPRGTVSQGRGRYWYTAASIPVR